MHISLVLVLYEGVAAWLSCVKILDEMNALDRSELLELPPQFCLGGVIVYPCLEERFERVLVLGGVFLRVWVPECDLLLQLVRHLFLLFLMLYFQSLASKLGLERNEGTLGSLPLV